MKKTIWLSLWLIFTIAIIETYDSNNKNDIGLKLNLCDNKNKQIAHKNGIWSRIGKRSVVNQLRGKSIYNDKILALNI